MSAPAKERSDAREAWRPEAAETLRVVAQMLDSMAQALDEDDGILGAIAGQGLVANLPALPAHIRHVLAEQLTDEAARGLEADRRYFEWEKSRAA